MSLLIIISLPNLSPVWSGYRTRGGSVEYTRVFCTYWGPILGTVHLLSCTNTHEKRTPLVEGPCRLDPDTSSSYGPGPGKYREERGSSQESFRERERERLLLCSRLHRALGERPSSWEPSQVAMTTTAGVHLQYPPLPHPTSPPQPLWPVLGETPISLMEVSPSSPQATSLPLACRLRKPLDPGENQGTRQNLQKGSFFNPSFLWGSALMS